MAILCPVVSMAQISERLGLAPYSLVIGVYLGLYLVGHVSASLAYPFLIAMSFAAGPTSVMCIAIPIGIVLLRANTRELFSIPGTITEDVVLAFVCGPCAIAQMATHVGSYEPRTCSFGPRSTLPGYEHQ
jgi:Cys-rich protein (TIGR01571 family)